MESAPEPVIQEVVPEQLGVLVSQAREHFDTAQQAQRTGDWGGFGQALESLGATIGELEGLVE